MVTDSLDARISRAAEHLARAEHVCCLTGAGISAESGVPTFRGAGGFWAGRRAEDLATPEAFIRDPDEVWQFYLWRRDQLRSKTPNAGHHALVAIEKRVAAFTLITQNVDNLHRLAGSRNIVELHGNLWVDRCTGCGHVQRDSGTTQGPAPDPHGTAGAPSIAKRWVGDRITGETPGVQRIDGPPPLLRKDGAPATGNIQNRTAAAQQTTPFGPIPHCPACGRMMRPGVVWFGEMLPADAIRNAQTAAATCDVMLVVGTSAVVQPAASLANWAQANGALVIEVNPEATPLSSLVDLRFPHAAGDVLRRIVALLVDRSV